ncbi:unnamed protein product [Parnassius apollo]|uniref:(apollo) hypothetical protein n=1 Tax=Parnassius apollo TaxID=110799 RepID=A0A8S3X7L1_PARAO|nr:unnamed protein product [Parnassius apollo]
MENKHLCIACKDLPPPPSEREKCLCMHCRQECHLKCLNMDKTAFFKLDGQTKSKWKCPTCFNVTNRRKGDISNTPVRKSVPFNDSIMSCDDSLSVEHSETSLDPKPSTSMCPSLGQEVTLESIARLLDMKLDVKLDEKFESLKKSFYVNMKSLIKTEIVTAIDQVKIEFTETTDFLHQGQKELKSNIESAEIKVKALERTNADLTSKMSILHRRLESMEKISRSHNVEIQAVPEKRNENILTIVKNIYSTVKLPTTDAEISMCRRVAKLPTTSAQRPRNILLSLPSIRRRDNLLSAVKRYNKANPGNTLSSVHLGIQGDICPIYVSEHLSPETKELFALTRATARGKYKYVWVKFGNIYVRKDDNSSAVHIKNKDCLAKIR